jgi:hypothetical protein
VVDHRDSGRALGRVIFSLERGAGHGYATETLWAERIGEDRFRLRNVPFFAVGVSAEDVVVARKKAGYFVFDRVSIRGGHLTYRITCSETASRDAIGRAWEPLEALGCTYEQGQGRLRAIDVPSYADIEKVLGLLEQGERQGIWEFEEGHCGHTVVRDPPVDEP